MKRKNSDKPLQVGKWVRGIFWDDVLGMPSGFGVIVAILVLYLVLMFGIVKSVRSVEPTVNERYDYYYAGCISIEATTQNVCHDLALSRALGE